MELARLVATIEADTAPLEKGLKTATDRINDMPKATATAAASGAQSLSVFEKGVNKVGSSFEAAAVGGVAFFAGMAALNKVGDALGFVAESAVGMNGRLEMARVGFTSMLGSAEAASAFLRQLQTLANETPFAFPELVDAAKRFLNMGVSAEAAIPMLQGVADAIARIGGGQAEIEQVSRALLQINTKGKVSAEEMNQLAEAGINGWRILADTMGITTGEAMKLAESGQVSADQWNKSFLSFTQANYGGEAKKQSSTFQGAMSTIVDSAGMAIAQGAKPLFDEISRGAQTIAEFVKSAEFAAWATRTQAAMSEAIAGVKSFAKELGETVRVYREFTAASGAKGALEGLISGLNTVENVVRRGLGFPEVGEASKAAAIAGARAMDGMASQVARDAETIAGAHVAAAKTAENAWTAFARKDLLTEALNFRETFKDPTEAVKEAAKNLQDAQKAMTDTIRRIGEVTAQETARVVEAHKTAADAQAKAYADLQTRVAAVVAAAAEKTRAAEVDAADKLAEAVAASGERQADIRMKAAQDVIAAGNAADAAINEALDRANEALAAAADAHAERQAQVQAGAAEKIAAAVADHAERVGAAQEKAAEAMAQAARAAQETIDAAYAAAGEKVATVVADFNEKATALIGAANEKHAAIAAERAEAIARAEETYADAVAAAVTDGTEKILGVQRDAATRIADAIADLALDRATRARRDALDTTLSAEERARRIQRDQAEAQYQFERDLARATSDEERARLAERFQRAQEDSAHRRQLAEEDRLFGEQQDAQRRALEDTLADEALQREIDRVTAQRDARVEGIKTELSERLAALAQAYADEVAAAEASAATKDAAVEAGVEKERKALYAWFAERLAAVDDALKKEVAAAERKQREREDAIRAGLSKELLDLGDALGKRQKAVEDQLGKELAAEDKHWTDKNAAVAKKRAEDITDAQTKLAERKRAIDTALGEEVKAEQDALDKRARAIAKHLTDTTTAIGTDATDRVAALNTSYADDVTNIELALADKLKKVGDEADAERAKLVASYADRIKDMTTEFLEKIPPGSAIKADNFIDALWAKLNEVRHMAEQAGTAIHNIPAAPAPSAPSRPAPSLSGSPHPQPGETAAGGPDPQGRYAYQRRNPDGNYSVEWRDRGGRGLAGHPYAVGVPEVYVPDRPGSFVPLGGAGGGGDVTIPVYIGGEKIATVVAKANERNARRGVR